LAKIGEGTCVWNQSQVREKVQIGDNCIIGKNVYIDYGVVIGKNVKIQNNVSVYNGVKIEDGVFVGPHVCFTNDKKPRAINPDESLKNTEDWEVGGILVKKGASLGANSTILPGIVVGEFAMVGAGSVVTKDVPNFVMVCGNPAIIKGYVCKCGKKIDENEKSCDVCHVNLNQIENDINSKT
jgi:UDP-2-acetamido-3-amino-2,3-dideoxy-glucuronate N-acetyltransferase